MSPPSPADSRDFLTSLSEQLRAYERMAAEQGTRFQAVVAFARLREMVDRFANDQSSLEPAPGPESALTPRELEVLQLAAKGLSNKEIAWQLNISDRTVQFHLKSVYEKLEASGRTEAVSTALKLGIIE